MELYLKFSVLILALFLSICFGDQCSINKLKAFKVSAKGVNEVQFLKELTASNSMVTVEKPARRLNSSFIFTAPDCVHPVVLALLRKFHIFDYEVFNPNFLPATKTSSRRFNIQSDFDSVAKRYLSYEEANIYIDGIAEQIRQANPRIVVEVRVEGYSFERRQMKSITIRHREKPNNPFILIDAGIHAREWHSRSMGLYLLNKLVDEAALNEKGLLYKSSFVIIPSLNPDGYEYSRAGDKLWRKTRNPINKSCVGVDGNRNYDVHWLEGDRESYPCSEVYRGPKAFSEQETRIVRDVMLRLKGRCKMYISIHTYGNSILYPYGYSTKQHPNVKSLRRVALAGIEAVKAETGAKFIADQSGSSLYIAAGGSDDYAIDVAGIPFAFTFELGAEEWGFAVKPEYLRKTLYEGYVAINAMVQEVLRF